MNSIPKITANSIVGMSGVEGRPVYFLTLIGQAGPSITVKGELKLTNNNSTSDAEISLKWGGKMMKNVNDDQVNIKIMDLAEVAAFKTNAQRFLQGQTTKLQAVSQNLVWTKMPFVNNLTDADVWKKDAQNNYTVDAAEVTKLLKKFADANVWLGFGKVLAIDAFNGNHDRFALNGSIVNEGNLFFQQTAQGVKVVGLDTFEAKGMSSNLTQGGVLSDLDVLNQPLKMKAVAEEMTRSVAGAIGRAMRKANRNLITVKLGQDIVAIKPDHDEYLLGYAPDVERGIQTGADDLKRYLLGKLAQYNQQVRPSGLLGNQRPATPVRTPFALGGQRVVLAKTVPEGIVDRMRYLRWI